MSQAKMMTKSISMLSVMLLLVAASLQAQVVKESDPQLKGIDVVEHLGEQIPLDLEFVNDAGDTVQLSHYFNQGRPVIIVLAYYTCPMLCTLVLNGVSDGLRELPWVPGDKFQVLTISIDPRETADLAAAKKHRYVESLNREGAAAGWDFMVGAESQSKALAEALGFKYYWDEANQQYAHPAVVFVLTEDGKISRYLYGLEFKPADLKLALLEASEGEIGSTVDRIILYCFHYDPEAGSYTVFAANVMKLGGVATMILLGAVLGLFWMRERHRRKA
ncbi:MAG: SCO family protein [bacterium]